jgi:putative Holliday junction resolvase
MRGEPEPSDFVPRVLAVDFGERRVGVAISDALGLTAQPLPTLEVSSLADAVRQLAQLVAETGAATIVVGLPLHLSGAHGARAARSERLARELEHATGLPVVLWDERLTSAEATRYLREDGKRRRARGDTDRVAATLMLAAYLERRRGDRPGT